MEAGLVIPRLLYLLHEYALLLLDDEKERLGAGGLDHVLDSINRAYQGIGFSVDQVIRQGWMGDEGALPSARRIRHFRRYACSRFAKEVLWSCRSHFTRCRRTMNCVKAGYSCLRLAAVMRQLGSRRQPYHSGARPGGTDVIHQCLFERTQPNSEYDGSAVVCVLNPSGLNKQTKPPSVLTHKTQYTAHCTRRAISKYEIRASAPTDTDNTPYLACGVSS